MKKTNEELLQFFGLKVGDKVKIEGSTSVYNIFKEDEVCEENDKYKHIDYWSTASFGVYLISRNYEIITPKKKVGELTCDEMSCKNCPIKVINCCLRSNDTFYKRLESYKKEVLSIGDLKPYEQAFFDSIKTELDKEVEECEK